jgi:hypothetical protein
MLDGWLRLDPGRRGVQADSVSGRADPPRPGVSREQRISAEGLQRLGRQLQSGAMPSRPVLMQWVRRYGEDALDLLRAHGVDTTDLAGDSESMVPPG